MGQWIRLRVTTPNLLWLQNGKLEEVSQDLKTDQFKGVMKTPASTRKVAAMVVAAVSAASSVQRSDSANAADVHESGDGIVPRRAKDTVQASKRPALRTT